MLFWVSALPNWFWVQSKCVSYGFPIVTYSILACRSNAVPEHYGALCMNAKRRFDLHNSMRFPVNREWKFSETRKVLNVRVITFYTAVDQFLANRKMTNSTQYTYKYRLQKSMCWRFILCRFHHLLKREIYLKLLL